MLTFVSTQTTSWF